MKKHEHPQAPAEPFTPIPLFGGIPALAGGKRPDQAATVADSDDLTDVIHALVRLAEQLLDSFLNIPGIMEDDGKIKPEKFDAATRLAFVSAGNALDYAKRLVDEKGSAARILKLRKELAEEMQAAGLTGDPADGESPME